MEALLAVAIAAAVLLPALGVFSAVVRGSAESSAAMRAHVAAEVALRSTSAAMRIGEFVEEIAVVETPVHIAVRTWQGGDTATNSVEVSYDAGGDLQRKLLLVMPPQLRSAKPGDGR